jgi:DNA polymerase-3 subunit chi
MKVEFHSGVPDKLVHACRLLRKSHAAGARVAVTGERTALDRLDPMLWTFDPASFVPHARLRAGAQPPASLLARTPIWLADMVDAPAQALGCTVLVNLGPEVPAQWDRFERLIEIVDASPEDSAQARARWRRYGQTPGVERVHHALGAG